MELKDFVKETLVQIVRGVDDANIALSDKTAFVASTNIKRPLKNGWDNNSLPFQDHFCLKKGNY